MSGFWGLFAVFLGVGALAFLASLAGSWWRLWRGCLRRRDAPGIAQFLQWTNRRCDIVVFLALAVLLLVEAILPFVHRLLTDAASSVTDRLELRFGGIYDFANGGGLLLGVALAALVGVAVGVVVGSWMACKTPARSRTLGLLDLL